MIGSGGMRGGVWGAKGKREESRWKAYDGGRGRGER